MKIIKTSKLTDMKTRIGGVVFLQCCALHFECGSSLLLPSPVTTIAVIQNHQFRHTPTHLAVNVASSNDGGGGLTTILEWDKARFLLDCIRTVAPWFLTSTFALVVVAGLQGVIAIQRYRQNFSDAPIPQIPCHGVIQVRAKCDHLINNNKTNISSNLIDLPDEMACLRLLVIGDSLAVGVGQSKKCYPVLPEEIAKEISKGLDGRVVYWTCCGQPGASTPWIVRMLQRSDTFDVGTARSCDGEYDVEGTIVQNEKISSSIQRTWCERLQRYITLFDPGNLQPYDVVVLVTGANDIKTTVMPFLFKSDQRDNKMQRFGITEDVRLFMKTINDQMERRMLMFRENLEHNVVATLQEIRLVVEPLAIVWNIDMDEYFDQIFGPADKVSKRERNSQDSNDSDKKSIGKDFSLGLHTLFVLPAMPARAHACLRRKIPLGWLGVLVFDFLDWKKQTLAQSNPESVIFVGGPAFYDMVNYENERGTIWEQRNCDEVILALRDIGYNDRRCIEDRMERYYSNKEESLHIRGLGTNMFSIDEIHPNEGGYTVWGRHIGRTILRRLGNTTRYQNGNNEVQSLSSLSSVKTEKNLKN